MRNILALIAAFTLSSTSTMSVIACNNSNERGTTNVFDWSSAFKDTNTTTDTFFNYLLNNPNSGWGNTLYTDINQYINLSILKNSPEFKEDYLAALISAKSEMENTIKSLQAKYGRSWEKQWKKALGDNDVNTYIDNILKKSALGIIQRSYVTSNYKDYKYYNQNEINIWLKDLWQQVRSNHNPTGIYESVLDYVKGILGGSTVPGKYASKIWIVANANSLDPDLKTFDKLNNAVMNAATWTNVSISLPVVKTTDDNNDSNYEIDSYNTIDGLLSDNQSKIAKVMLRNQELIWTRQIVIPFDSTAKPLEEKINDSQFSQNKTKINEILNNITNNGFDQTFTEEKGEATTDVNKTGDLGLMDITKSSQDNSPFYYYLYRYVTSYQGVGKNVTGIQPYKLTQFTETSLEKLIPYIDRDNIKKENQDGTSQYSDLVYMEDKKGPQLPDAAVNNGPGVGIFIDKGGIHFIQTPGITYQQKDKPANNKTTYNIIKDFKNHRKDNYQWADLAPLSERPGGLIDSPYLDYLQTDFLLQKYTPNIKPTFDLNDALTTFTGGAGGTGSIGDATWWDYNLYFNENSNLISWNIQAMTGSSPVDPTDKNISSFAEKMKSWFDKTKENRWNNRQGININATFKDNVIKQNAAWDALTQDAPVARMDIAIANYLDVIGKRTLWWYDPSIISS
ncbi:hypothetical protein [Spiroplasma endosymbiont of Polydrusus pterygomalis]|uniref:hypothetical protein n=1 Tax=Spiroplasma endosymbiont of Polydrusus pterygomalis TaxID=3139327 RepID=UPI003CCA8037